MDMRMKIDYICEMNDKLIKELKVQMDGNLSTVNTGEAGEIADMIKDFSESEKNFYEAQYYKSVVDAMENKNSPAMMKEYGYNMPQQNYGVYDQQRRRPEYLEGGMDWTPVRDAYREGDRRYNPNYNHRMPNYREGDMYGNPNYREGMYGPNSQMGAVDTYLSDPNVSARDNS